MRNIGVPQQQAIMNAFVASFAVHSRNLIHFMYPKSPDTDDVLAKDFFPGPSDWRKLCPKQSKVLEDAVGRAHKEIAHLTYSRLKVTHSNRAWDWDKIYYEIHAVLQIFLKHVPSHLLSNKWGKI